MLRFIIFSFTPVVPVAPGSEPAVAVVIEADELNANSTAPGALGQLDLQRSALSYRAAPLRGREVVLGEDALACVVRERDAEVR